MCENTHFDGTRRPTAKRVQLVGAVRSSQVEYAENERDGVVVNRKTGLVVCTNAAKESIFSVFDLRRRSSSLSSSLGALVLPVLDTSAVIDGVQILIQTQSHYLLEDHGQKRDST